MASPAMTKPTVDLRPLPPPPAPPAPVDEAVKVTSPAMTKPTVDLRPLPPPPAPPAPVDDATKLVAPVPAIPGTGIVEGAAQPPVEPPAKAPEEVPYDDADKILPEESNSGPEWPVKPNEEFLTVSPVRAGLADASDDVLALGNFVLDANDEDISMGDLVNVEESDDDEIAGNVMSRPVEETEEMEGACMLPGTEIDTLMLEVTEENKAAANEIVEEFKRKLKALQGGRIGVKKTISKNGKHVNSVIASVHWKKLVADYPVVGELLESYHRVPEDKDLNPDNDQYRCGMKKVLEKVSMGCNSMEELAIATAQFEQSMENMSSGLMARKNKALPILRKGIGQKLGEGWVVRKSGKWTAMKSPGELPK